MTTVLTPLESEVLSRIVAGQTGKQIAAELHYSHYYIKEIMTRIRQKFRASSMPQAVAVAFREGILL